MVKVGTTSIINNIHLISAGEAQHFEMILGLSLNTVDSLVMLFSLCGAVEIIHRLLVKTSNRRGNNGMGMSSNVDSSIMNEGF